MTKIIHCKDLGFDCQGVLEAETNEELLTMAAEHAKDAHGVEQVSDEMFQKLKAVIREKEG